MAIAQEGELVRGGLDAVNRFDGLSDFCTYASALCVVAEFSVNVYRYHKNEITGKQLVRRGAKSVGRAVAMFYGSQVGMTLGIGAGWAAGVVAALTMGVTASGAGLIALAGALFGSYYGTKKTGELYDYVFNKLFPDGEEIGKQQQIRDAFTYFQFTKEEIAVFSKQKEKSEKELLTRFRHFAKLHHPDRKSGSHDQFLKLNIHYGVLKGLLNCDTTKNTVSEFVDNALMFSCR